jgi:hypothetical protein
LSIRCTDAPQMPQDQNVVVSPPLLWVQIESIIVDSFGRTSGFRANSDPSPDVSY